MTDHELLSQYVRHRSNEAMGELVRRHVDTVYATALRELRDAHLAEDVTQAVFMVLAQRAKSLSPKVVQLRNRLLAPTRVIEPPARADGTDGAADAAGWRRPEGSRR